MDIRFVLYDGKREHTMIAFAKYPSLLELEKRRGVDLGHAYMSDHILQMSGQTHIWPDICQTPQNNYNWLCVKAGEASGTLRV